MIWLSATLIRCEATPGDAGDNLEEELDMVKNPTSARLIAMAILLIPTTVLAEEHSSRRIGFVAGPTYGVGLSYGRQNTSTGIGWQVSGFPVWFEEDRLLFGGFTLFKTLHEGSGEGALRLFLSGGVAAYYSWHDNRNGYYYSEIDSEIDETLTLVFGPGVGLELRAGPFDLSAGGIVKCCGWQESASQRFQAASFISPSMNGTPSMTWVMSL